MRAFLIDPEAKTVNEVLFDGDYHQIYTLIGAECFDVCRLPDNDGIFVDDEGLVNGKPQSFFMHIDAMQPLAGKGLVLGCDEQGNTVEPKTTLDHLRRSVVWLEPVIADGEVGMAVTGVGTDNHQ